MIKRIFIDLDGTLLNKKSKISKKNKHAFEKLLVHNIKPTISTGRNWRSTLNYCKQLNLINTNNHCIVFNGALIMDLKTMKPIYHKKIESSQVLKLINFLISNKWQFICYSHSKAIGHGFDWVMKKVAKNMSLQIEHSLDLKKYNQDFYKIVIWKFTNFFTNKHIDNLFKNFDQELEIVFTDKKAIEITNKDVNKKTAADYILELTKESYETSSAVGDNENDSKLLQSVKLGIVMGNAKSHIKNNSLNIVSSNNKNGFSEAVQLCLKN